VNEEAIELVDKMLAQIEREEGYLAGSIKLIALIEMQI